MDVSNKILVVPTGTAIGRTKGEKGVGFHSTATPNGGTTKRKKVTFDLDLQVHTIPNRIPFYEKRPVSTRGLGDPLNFTPRPLDLKGKDRFEFGDTAATPGRIIDLFAPVNGTSFASSSLNSFPARTVLRNSPSGQPTRSLDFHYPTFKNGGSRISPAYHKLPTHTYRTIYGERTGQSAEPGSQRLSRAAENLREITAELRDQFESSISLTDTSKYFVSENGGRKGSAGSRSASALPGSQRQSLPVSEISIGLASRSKQQPGPVHLKSTDTTEPELQQRNGSATAPSQRSRPQSHPVGMTPQSHALRRVPTAATETIRRHPPHSASSAIRDPVRQIQATRPTVNLATVGLHLDSTQQYLPDLEAAAAAAARPFYHSSSSSSKRSSSRCSTIDTYVISDVDVSVKNNLGRQSGMAKKRVLSSPNRCWVNPSEDDYTSFTDPLLATNLPAHQLQISSRPPNINS